MSDLSNVIRILPTMKSGKELLSALEVFPEYDSAICDADAPVRIMALSDLYRIYVPNQNVVGDLQQTLSGVDAVIAEEGDEAGSPAAEPELQGHHAAGVQRHHGWLR